MMMGDARPTWTLIIRRHLAALLALRGHSLRAALRATTLVGGTRTRTCGCTTAFTVTWMVPTLRTSPLTSATLVSTLTLMVTICAHALIALTCHTLQRKCARAPLLLQPALVILPSTITPSMTSRWIARLSLTRQTWPTPPSTELRKSRRFHRLVLIQ